MEEKSNMELIGEFIETCPLLNKGKVNLDFIDSDPQSYSIDETPVDPVLNYFKDSGRRLQIQFDFSIQANFSVLENVKNSKFCDNFMKWIYEQNEKDNLPKIEGIDWIKCLGRGTITRTSDTTAIYSIPMQVAYDEDF